VSKKILLTHLCIWCCALGSIFIAGAIAFSIINETDPLVFLGRICAGMGLLMMGFSGFLLEIGLTLEEIRMRCEENEEEKINP
jgi:hypothetical protein